ncbi:hypothetical protein [Agromyces bauzanensis]|uniref:Uncharacterized protein n=1 Tax=Agromyces bauzanensis TaxID=1308924 RepID=A0A917PGX0_9MICO|nr:hypothetical protein [Agromyces bauzanensis]GGJ78040.1 hypothetical protein GCM10011372_15470 [Agromyces bauzanensis]
MTGGNDVGGTRGIIGIVLGLAAGLAFGAGGAIVKPLLESPGSSR